MPRCSIAALFAISLVVGAGCSTNPDSDDSNLAGDAVDETDGQPDGRDSYGSDASDVDTTTDTEQADASEDDSSDADAFDDETADADSSDSADAGDGGQNSGPDCSKDSDSDGLTDCEEREMCTDPYDGDTDDDHLGDLEEIQHQTNPCKADTDNDGVPDNEEVNRFGLDPNRPSSYDDGIIDGNRWYIDHCQDAEPEEVGFHKNQNGNWTIALPTAFDYSQLSQTGLDRPEAAAVFDDSSNEVSGALISVTAPAGQPSPRDPLDGQIDSAVRTLAQNVAYDPLGATFETHNMKQAAIREYEVTLPNEMSARKVRETLLFDATKLSKPVQNLPNSAGAKHEQFRIEISVTRRNHLSGERTNLIAIAVAPLDKYSNSDLVQFRVDDVVNTTNVSDAQDTIKTDCNLQKPGDREPKAEFYWLFDPSGSMDEEAALVRNFGRQFVQRIRNTQLDYRLGVTNTDPQNNGTLRAPPAWHTKVDTFITEIRNNAAGSGCSRSGCFDEKGIEAATKGLKFMNGHGTNAPSSAEEIRSGAQVFTIILSDEEAQGDWQPEPNGRHPRATYLTQNSTVFALVAETESPGCSPLGPEPDGHYDHVANKSGGASTDLCSDKLTQFLEEIVRKATGYVSSFELSETPISSSLRVFLDGEWVPRSTEDGFDYYPQSNTIAFFGEYRPDFNPEPGEEPDWLAVTYEAYDTRCKQAQRQQGVDTCPLE